MRDDPFFAVLAAHPDCRVDYCLIDATGPYRGEDSHRAALEEAMRALAAEDGEDGPAWGFDARRASARPIAAETLLALPETPWKHKEKWKDGSEITVFDFYSDGGPIPYWFAFLEPPHGSRDTPGDFAAVNAALFPLGTAALEAYEWSTDWSDYFDDGHEWWGTGCWSVYDPGKGRFAVILASATD